MIGILSDISTIKVPNKKKKNKERKETKTYNQET